MTEESPYETADDFGRLEIELISEGMHVASDDIAARIHQRPNPGAAPALAYAEGEGWDTDKFTGYELERLAAAWWEGYDGMQWPDDLSL